jgi:16S rRNA (adenine1518-N6/adenine1519-N6)-dimethyltransferase
MGIEPRRSWGQNFLIDPEIPEKEAALVDLPPRSSIVEIGGGLGDLTRALLARGFTPVKIIEIDPHLAAFLETNFRSGVSVVVGDALKVPLPRAAAYVGNLPFSTSAPIIERLLEEGIEHGVFLVQKELAERLTSPPGRRSYGPLSVLTRVHGEFVVAGKVPSESFFPPPKVEGALVVYRRAPLDPQPRDLGLLKQLLAGLFTWRRKTLTHAVPKIIPKFVDGNPEEILRASDWPEAWRTMRAEEISAEDYIRLANVISGKHQAYMAH